MGSLSQLYQLPYFLIIFYHTFLGLGDEEDYPMYHFIWTIANVFLMIGSILYMWFFQPHDNSLIIINFKSQSNDRK